jgi:hypothetical protein
VKPRLAIWVVLAVSIFLNLFFVFRELHDSANPNGDIGRRLGASEIGFEDFETVAFAREFLERFTSFESETFRSTQTATSYLMEEATRLSRLADVERLTDKMRTKRVVQRGKLMLLSRESKNTNRFQARVHVDLIEGTAEKSGLQQEFHSSYILNLEFEIQRVSRSAQNPWGLLVANLNQSVSTSVPHQANPATEALIRLRPGTSVALRFPCMIENVELPKGTSLKVRLTTLDISEVQLRTDQRIEGDQLMKAVCRDRSFRVRVNSEPEEGAFLLALKVFTFDDAEPIRKGHSNGFSKLRRAKSEVERSVEEQLGFIIEAE